MENNRVVLHSVSPEELKELMREMIQFEFQKINNEIQMAIGDDDLISTGNACRLLGVCSKYFKILVQDGHFTVFHHLKERRFKRAELLEYRNRWRQNKVI